VPGLAKLALGAPLDALAPSALFGEPAGLSGLLAQPASNTATKVVSSAVAAARNLGWQEEFIGVLSQAPPW
jgi:hypothetical protein